MKSRVLFALLAATLLATGCSTDDNNEWQRVVCSVQSINEGAPVVSAALNTGTDMSNPVDDYIPLDIVNVRFWARPGNSMSTITETGPYSAFVITSYDATWIPGAGAPPELTSYNLENALLSARVPINDEFVSAFLIAPQAMKLEPWYPQPDGSTVFTAYLQLTFYGHEEGSQHIVAIPAGTTVTFLGAIGENN